MNVPVIAMASSPDSTLAQQADVYLDISVKQEACSLGLAPTSSTTVTLVLGDALAVSLLEARGFTSEDFALSHPGGSLGRRLLLRVDDIMLRNQDIPLISESANISEALLEVSKKGLGLTGVIDAEHTLKGIFTDGDLRRILDQKIDLHATPISQVMTKNGVTVSPQEMAVDALNTMEEKRISALMVVDADRKPVGAFNMHILLKAGVV
jgi:arabinose-5-phosphate isomerase